MTSNGQEPADRGLIQIVYVSEAIGPVGEAELDAIRSASEARNRTGSLTGLLLFQRPRFFGVLEGSCRRVIARMEVIATDRRHSGLRVLREEPITARRFDNWTFGMLPPVAQGPDRSEEFIRTLCERLA